MKKSTKIAGIVLGLGVMFSTGAIVGANVDWKTSVESEANRRIAAAGYHKREEIKAKAGDLSQQMLDALNPKIQAEQDELTRLLEEYYQLKIKGLTESEDFRLLEQKIEQIRNNQYERYKKEIDAIFAGQ